MEGCLKSMGVAFWGPCSVKAVSAQFGHSLVHFDVLSSDLQGTQVAGCLALKFGLCSNTIVKSNLSPVSPDIPKPSKKTADLKAAAANLFKHCVTLGSQPTAL